MRDDEPERPDFDDAGFDDLDFVAPDFDVFPELRELPDFDFDDFLAVDFFDDDLLEEDFAPDDFSRPPEPFLPADFPLPLFPLPDFLPPPLSLFTVAQARSSATLSDTPRSL